MDTLLGRVDRLLRGELTRAEVLDQGTIPIPARSLAPIALLLGASYGLFLALFGVLTRGDHVAGRLLATMAKIPLLYLLTLAVTFPSLYVFSALARSRLSFRDTLRLLVAAVTVGLAVLASFGPVAGFFALCTRSYRFLAVLNIAFFTLSGLIAVVFLWRTLARLLPDGGDRRATRAARRIFLVWLAVFGCVGAQMGWVLRPFLGNPAVEWTLWRPRESSAFRFVFDTLCALGNG